MSADPARRTIIIKRAAHADHEEHGGQWKVAYADFVTAMMAFFLIMWLLSSTTEKQREGIAKYFSPATILDMKTGNGIFDGGQSILGGAESSPANASGADNGAGEADREAAAAAAAAAVAASEATLAQQAQQAQQLMDRTERQRFEAVKAELEKMMQGGPLAEFSDTLQVEMTREGMRIQIFDRDSAPMFQPGGAEPTTRLTRILAVIGQVLGTVRNSVILTGHTDQQALRRGNYSNWELSADRANAARRGLEASGVNTGRMLKVEGRAATEPLATATPGDPRNRRVAVTILRQDAEAALRVPATREARPAAVPAVPAPAVPAPATPARTTPAQAVPVQTTSLQPTPGPTLPSQVTPGQTPPPSQEKPR